MDQRERLRYLIDELERDCPDLGVRARPTDEKSLQAYLRALFNVRPVMPASAEFLRVQDDYLRQRLRERGGSVDFDAACDRFEAGTQVHGGALQEHEDGEFRRSADGLWLWQGDITRLRVGAIVNAANSQLLGCWVPGHHCIDNAIHTYAGVQLRLSCAQLMRTQGHEEPTGRAKVTAAFNLPSRFVLHTVGPIVQGGQVTPSDRALLSSCYVSCLDAAAKRGVRSVAFCCISTGVFGYPPEEAARVAVRAVRDWRARKNSDLRILFDVFRDEDREIYERELGLK